jgi:ribosomal protein S18 acetylase RimI-like enzyme
MATSIEHDPAGLTFEEFTSLNDVCFPHESVGMALFGEFTSAHLWTVRESGLLVGYSVMSRGSKTPYIRRIGIHPDLRCRGLANNLMSRMLSVAEEDGVSEVHASVEQDNHAAIGLNRKFGFEITGESVNFSIEVRPSQTDAYQAVPFVEYDWDDGHLQLPESLKAWGRRHDPPHSIVLVFLADDRPIGYTRFCPDFPGCSPFVLFEDSDAIEDLVGLLDEYVLPGRRAIKVTAADATAVASFERAGTHVNYRMFEMTKRLGSASQ